LALADSCFLSPQHPLRKRVNSRNALQGQTHHSLNLRVTDLARRPGARFVQQPIQPPLQEPSAPFADGLVGQPELVRHRGIGPACRALQDDVWSYPVSMDGVGLR
jgi:hypothetical protein